MKTNRKYSLCNAALRLLRGARFRQRCMACGAFAAARLLVAACLLAVACTAEEADEQAAVADGPITVRASVAERTQSGTRAEGGRETEGWTVNAGHFALVYPSDDGSNHVGVCSFSELGGRAYHASRGTGDGLVENGQPLLPGELGTSSSGTVLFYMDNVPALEAEGTEAPGEIVFDDALKARFSAREEDREHRPGASGDDNTTNDLVWGICEVENTGEESDYYDGLTFELNHRMSRISVLIIDEYKATDGLTKQPYDENPMKIWISGVRTQSKSFNRETGVVTVDSDAPSTDLYLLGTEDADGTLVKDKGFTEEEQAKFGTETNVEVTCYTTPNTILPPQTFDKSPSLYIQYNGKTYKGLLPNTIASQDEHGHTTNKNMQFEAGKHLLLKVRFKPSFHDELKFDVSLVDWFTFGGSTWSVSGLLAGIHTVDMWKEFVRDYNGLAEVEKGSAKEAAILEKLRRYGDMTKTPPEFLLITHITKEDFTAGGDDMLIKREVYEQYPFLIDFRRGYMIKGYKYEYKDGCWVSQKVSDTGDDYVEERLTSDTKPDRLPEQLLDEILTPAASAHLVP